MSSQIVNITLPKELVNKIDTAAKLEYGNRSEYIRRAIVDRLKAEEQDVWSELIDSSVETSKKSSEAGYTSDEDFVRAVKEVHKNTN